MDNLRLEHPGPFSAHAQAGTHHLLPFAPPPLEFPPQLNKPTNINTHHQHSISYSSSWASLWTEPQFSQNHNALLKHGMQSPERGHGVAVHSPDDGPARPWDISADTILQPKHGHSINISTEFPQAASASMEVLRGDSPTLQLKHGGTLLAHEFGHLTASLDAARGNSSHVCAPMNGLSEGNAHTPNDFRKGNTHLPGLLVAMDKGSTSPVSVVSGPQPVPFSCKMDGAAGQNQRFVSFSWHDKDDSERATSKGTDGAVTVKAEVMGESSPRLIESFRGECTKQVSGSEEKGRIVKKEQEGGVTIASLEDGSIGLKLGKRTYYGDVGGEEASRRANSTSTCNGAGKNNSKNSSSVSCAATTTTTTTPTNATTITNINKNTSGGGIANKKQKGSSASAVVPACQAEGCTADLSGAKDYHRRHKVCEWHSKASKAKVNNLEQRFCQQCSRFHVLSAFDEGKRSCRRRLAGHNERRRKPPPEPMPFLSPGGFAYFADGRVNAALHDHPYFLQHRRASLVPASVDNAVLACQLGLAGFPQQETMGNYHALELHHFMQGLPPGGGSGAGVLDGGGALMLANGNTLALSNASSLPTPASSSSVGLLPHGSSEMAISGRALSLLSSSLGSPETMSISLGMTSPSIDQFLSDTQALASSSRQQVAPSSTSCFSSGIGMSSALHGLSQSHNHALNSLTSSSSGCSTEIDQAEPPHMSNFEGRSLFLMHSESSFQNLQESGNSNHGRPMLDLMQISPAESHHHQQSQAELSYADLQGLSIFNKQNIM